MQGRGCGVVRMCTRSPNKLRRSNSIFYLWYFCIKDRSGVADGRTLVGKNRQNSTGSLKDEGVLRAVVPNL
jgi:hypothetical protein